MADHVRGSWLVYFNGIETPALSANISSGVWQIPQASISIPADRLMQRIGADDRVRVEVFALDSYRSTTVPSAGEQFRLAFEGEIVQYAYNSTSQGRAISFTAVDLMESLTRIFSFFLSSLDSIAVGQAATDQASASGVVNPFAPQHALLTAGLTGTGAIKRPYDFVQNVLKLLLDESVMTNERSVIITEWFKPWNERTGFSKRFVPSAFVEDVSPDGEVPAFPIFRAAQYAEGTQALADVGSRLGMGGTMYQLIQTVYQHVYYELAMIPNPPVLSVNTETRAVVGDSTLDDKAPETIVLKTAEEAKKAEAVALKAVEDAKAAWEALATLNATNDPKRPSTAGTRDAQRKRGEELKKAKDELAAIQAAGVTNATTEGQITQADAQVKAARDRVAKQEGVVAKDSTPETRELLRRAKAFLVQREEILAQKKKDQQEFFSSKQGNERVIASYMTKPQMLFGVAPSFNVLWPSMYEQFSYEENFALQPTRTYIGDPHIHNLVAKGGQSTAKSAIDKRALTVGYPQEANQRLVDRQKPGNKVNQHNFLIQYEEYFKGPVYNQLTTPPWFMHLANRGVGGANEEGSLQRLYARYEHERTRASRRNGGVQGPYNPYVVAGFPGVVLDNEESNNHVFAYLTTVTHSFTTSSMNTSIAFTHAQTFGEFFATLSDQYFQDKIVQVTEETPVSVPQHPIRQLRDRFQIAPKAKEYYQRMFWGTPEDIPEEVIFDPFAVIGVRDASGEMQPIGFNPPMTQDEYVIATEDLKAQADVEKTNSTPGTRDALAKRQAAVDAQPILNGTPNPRTGEPPAYIIHSQYRELMRDPLKAFAFASRPICTLDQYIDSKGENGVRRGLRTPNNKQEGKGAAYYVKIFQLNNDPIVPVPESSDGFPCAPLNTDVRRNWEARLLAYRKKVYTARHPFKA